MNKRVAMVAVPVLVAMIAAWFLLLWSPKGKEIDEAHERQEAAETQRQELDLRVARLRAAKARGAELQAERDQLVRTVPDQPDLAQLILDINNLAETSGVAFVTITPTPPAAAAPTAPSASPTTSADTPAAPTASVSTVKLALNIRGDYHPVLDFLDRLAELDRILVVTQISISPSNGTGGAGTDTLAPPQLTVTMSADAFTTASPQTAADAASAAAQPKSTTSSSSSTAAPAAQGGK